MSKINIKELEELCLKALINAGLNDHDAHVTVHHYLENELSGKTSHGMVRIVQAAAFIQEVGTPTTKPTLSLDNGNIATIDGQMNIAPVIGKMVLEESIARAQKHGIAFVGGKNYFGNTGSMAYYLNRLADKGLVSFISCNSVAVVAAPKGKDALIGTNPIGLAIPSDDGQHFISDFATSAIAYGKVLVAMDKNHPLPEGCIIDKDGNPSTNPEDAFPNGAILPLADYRGFSLGLFVEMLALLMGADVIKDELHGKDAIFMITIDPKSLNNAGYANKVESILNQIRQSAPAPDNTSVSIPGDRSQKTLEQNLEAGVVNIADKTLEKLRELCL